MKREDCFGYCGGETTKIFDFDGNVITSRGIKDSCLGQERNFNYAAGRQVQFRKCLGQRSQVSTKQPPELSVRSYGGRV